VAVDDDGGRRRGSASLVGAAVASRQGGVLTRDQVRACGYGDAFVRRMVRTGAWTLLRRGVYAETADLERTGRLIATAAAGWMALGRRGVLSHRTAATLHGLAIVGGPGPTQLTAPPGVLRPRTTTGLRISTAGLPAHHITTVHGLPVTTPARTVLDLARSSPHTDGVVVAESALRQARTERAELDRLLLDCWTWPGIRQATRVVAFAGDRSDSALESVCRVVFAGAGLPAPEQQALLVDERDGWFARVDFLWERHRTVVEADGRGKYGGPADLWSEKLRQERIEELGYAVLRVTWAQVAQQPTATVARVLRTFARGALLTGSRLPTRRPA